MSLGVDKGELFGIDQKFVRNVDFKDLTEEWIEEKKSDHELKILRIENCPSFEEGSSKLSYSNWSVLSRLFVVVLDVPDGIEAPTENVVNMFLKNLYFGWLEIGDKDEFLALGGGYDWVPPCKGDRPLIFQINTPNQSKCFVKHFHGVVFFELLSERSTNRSLWLRILLKHYTSFNGDILAVKMSPLFKEAVHERMSADLLTLRVLNLFEGGIGRIMPWLAEDSVLKTAAAMPMTEPVYIEGDFIDDEENLRADALKTYFAFLDYPIDDLPAIERAWQLERFDLVEKFISLDCMFPGNIDISQMPTSSTEFKKELEMRRDLHKAVAEKNFEEVSKILLDSKYKKLKRCFNELNEGVFFTCLRHFDPDIFGLLLKNGLNFCEKYKDLLENTSLETKKMISDKNTEFLRKVPYLNGIKQSWVPAGQLNMQFHCRAIAHCFMKLKQHPVTNQLVELAKKSRKLKIIFDFEHENTAIIEPTVLEGFGLFSSKPLEILIGAKRTLEETSKTLAHELAHLAMQKLYKDPCNPYRKNDKVRKRIFEEIVNEFDKESIPETSLFAGSVWMDELIVLVPQLCAGSDELDKSKAKCLKLFDYYFKYIVPDIDALINKINLRRTKIQARKRIYKFPIDLSALTEKFSRL